MKRTTNESKWLRPALQSRSRRYIGKKRDGIGETRTGDHLDVRLVLYQIGTLKIWAFRLLSLGEVGHMKPGRTYLSE